MKRLQVGDECYVRAEGEIYRCMYAGRGCNTDHIALPLSEKMQTSIFDISKRSLLRLVYPFPCIKELAI